MQISKRSHAVNIHNSGINNQKHKNSDSKHIKININDNNRTEKHVDNSCKRDQNNKTQRQSHHYKQAQHEPQKRKHLNAHGNNTVSQRWSHEVPKNNNYTQTVFNLWRKTQKKFIVSIVYLMLNPTPCYWNDAIIDEVRQMVPELDTYILESKELVGSSSTS